MFRGDRYLGDEGETGDMVGGMRPLGRDEIIAAFSKRDKRKLKLPQNLEAIEWNEREYLSWSHPDGSAWFVVYDLFDEVHGLVLEKVEAVGFSAKQCSWCATTNAGDKIAQFVVRHASNKELTIGNYVCANLDCSDFIRNKKHSTIATFSSYPTLEKRIKNLKKNLDELFFRVLF